MEGYAESAAVVFPVPLTPPPLAEWTWRETLMKKGSQVKSSVLDTSSKLAAKAVTLGRTVSRRSTALTSSAAASARTLKTTASERVTALRTNAVARVTAMRSGVRTELAASPAKWAGVAAGAGAGIGLLGRYLRYRRDVRLRMPRVIVVQSC